MPPVNRRSFVRAVQSLGISTVAANFLSKRGAAGKDSDDKVKYVAGWYIKNKEAAYSGEEEPIVKRHYDTISRSKLNKVEAQENVEKKIANRISEMGNKKDLELIRPTLFNGGGADGQFVPNIRIDYTNLGDISPDISKNKIKREFKGSHEGKSNNGENSYEVNVSISEIDQKQTDHCHDESSYEIDQDYIEAGVAFEVQPNQEHNGTTGPYAFDSNDGVEVWMSVAHLCPDIGNRCYQWANGVGTSPFFGWVHERAAGGIYNQNDMATIKNDSNDPDEPRRYIFGDSNCNLTDYRFTEGRSNNWIQNNQGTTGYNQGRTTGRDSGSIQYRPNNLSFTAPQVLVEAEAQEGDSGGPMFELSYNDKYSEYQAYILGCIAYRTSNGNSLGNTFQAYKNQFDINI